MRDRVLALTLALIAAAIAGERVEAAMQVGGRAGWVRPGGDLFEGSGGPGSHGLYGVALSIDLFPMTEMEVAYEWHKDELVFEEGRFEDTVFSGPAEYETDSFLLGGKLVIPAGFVSLVGGGGGSLQQTEIRIRPRGGFIGTDLDELTGERNEWAWHVLGGVRVHLVPLPLLLYAEIRYQRATETPSASYSAAYGGINLHLD